MLSDSEVERILVFAAHPDDVDFGSAATVAKWTDAGFSALERNAGAPYLFGDKVTMADVCLVPQIYNARRFNVDLAPYPRLVAIDERLAELPAVRSARPENQPDADPSA